MEGLGTQKTPIHNFLSQGLLTNIDLECAIL